jgi:hypothetical protein
VTLAILTICGCEPGTTGLLRPLSGPAEHSITNAIATTAQTAAGVLPAPWPVGLQALSAALLATLAAWQTITHRTVRRLVNGGNKPKKETPV